MPKPTQYDRAHLRNLTTIGTYIDRIYKKAAEEAARLGASVRRVRDDRAFSFDDYPETGEQVNSLLSSLAASTETAIVHGVRSAWTLSNNKNNEISRTVFGDNVGRLSQEQYRRYFSTNDSALEAFIARKEQGLNLSDRVWRYTNAFKSEIEMGLDLGIREGMDAPALARSLQQYLQHPDKLFRRVRDEYGMLHLSKAAADFHPGQGVYRSSYKNARRLAATETNIAYRTSDHLRWQQMDFVVGIEVKTSNNHTLLGADGKPHAFYDICDRLAGRYPKDFKFTGWHPHCRCHAEAILKTDEEIDADTQRILDGENPTPSEESENAVTDLPQAFKDHLEKYADTIRGVDNSRLPYYVQDNRERVDEVLGLAEETQSSTISRTSLRHAQRTQEEILDIQSRWNLRKDEMQYSPEQRANFRAIEQNLGIKRGLSMSYEEANTGKENPHFADDKSYKENCQTCTVTHWLRRLGFDVEAKPNIKLYTKHHGTLYDALDNVGVKWTDRFLNQDGSSPNYDFTCNWKSRKGYFKMTPNRLQEYFNEKFSSDGTYEVYCAWKKKYAHVFCVEVKNGIARFFDPQSGAYEVSRYISNMDPEWVGVIRLDEKIVNPKIGELFIKN
jgi:hypothetical protein